VVSFVFEPLADTAAKKVSSGLHLLDGIVSAILKVDGLDEKELRFQSLESLGPNF